MRFVKVNNITSITNLAVVFVIFFCSIKNSGSINCHKCYRLEECPLKNCSEIYEFVNSAYRNHFIIENERSLTLCPSESDENSWKKLEIDGSCGKSYSNQPCVVSHFKISEPNILQTIQLNGVFLGCPEKFFGSGVTKHVSCVRRSYNLENNKKKPQNKVKVSEFHMELKLCSSNCVRTPEECDVCFEDGCIYGNNTNIKTPWTTPPSIINYAIIGFALILAITQILACLCQSERMQNLNLINPGGDVYPNLNKA